MKSNITEPTLDTHGWILESAVEQNQRWPTSFHIPPQEARENLQIGALVKLLFCFAVHDDENPSPDYDLEYERMWVKVTEIKPNGYIGELENSPVMSDVLTYGDLIHFQPHHIASIAQSSR